VRHETNRGYGAAFATALHAAHGDDLLTDETGNSTCRLAPVLVEAQSADVVVGYRHRRADNAFADSMRVVGNG